VVKLASKETLRKEVLRLAAERDAWRNFALAVERLHVADSESPDVNVLAEHVDRARAHLQALGFAV
jgi:hypothetical protein